MTQEQIEKLAKEYAEFRCNTYPSDLNVGGVSIIDTVTNNYKTESTEFLEWLLRNHLIVNRDIVLDSYQIACADTESNDFTVSVEAQAEKRLLEAIYGRHTLKPFEI